MKPSSLIVTIPEPCQQDWNAMQPDATGRFCSSCSKSVVDFSNKTDLEIRDLLMENQNKKICGHFKKTQVDRPLSFTVPLEQLPRNISASRAFAIAVFLVFGSLLFSCTNHYNQPLGEIAVTGAPLPVQQTLPVDTPVVETLLGDTLILEKFCPSDLFIKGDVAFEEPVTTPETHIQGKIKLEPLSEEPPVKDTLLPEMEFSGLMGLMEVVIAEPDSADRLQNKNNDTEQPVAVDEQLLLYPNPSKGEVTISYALAKRGDVKIDILDMEGRLLGTPVNVKGQYEGCYQIPVNIGHLPNGIYIVALTKGSSRITEKLILEK